MRGEKDQGSPVREGNIVVFSQGYRTVLGAIETGRIGGYLSVVCRCRGVPSGNLHLDGKRRVVVFLKNFPEIDHITPVIYKLSSLYDVKVEVVVIPFTNVPNSHFEDDYRIRYLSGLEGVTVHDYNEFRPSLQAAKEVSRSFPIRAVKRIGSTLPTDLPRKVWNRTVPDHVNHPSYPDPGLILDQLAGDGNTVVVTDWPPLLKNPIGVFMDELVTVAKDRGFPTISLPHASANFCNFLTTESVLNHHNYDFEGKDLSQLDHGHGPVASGWDYYVESDEIISHSWAISEEKRYILGSPRYNEEWVEKVSTIAPRYRGKDEGNYNVLFFMPSERAPVYTEEVLITIKIIDRIPGVNLILNGHPRQYYYREIEKFVDGGGNNVRFEKDWPSVSLLNWADLVLNIHGSIVLDPVVRDMPVLSLDYLHPNREVISSRLAGVEINYRDHVYEIINDFRRGNRSRVYSKAAREQFINEFLVGQHDDVLTGYADFIFDRFEENG